MKYLKIIIGVTIGFVVVTGIFYLTRGGNKPKNSSRTIAKKDASLLYFRASRKDCSKKKILPSGHSILLFIMPALKRQYLL
jgi:hypothetical protein